MGKLVDKLQQIGQTSGSGFGFIGSRTPSQKPRPAAVLVALGAGDTAAVEAAVTNGADALLVTGWTPRTDVSAIRLAADNGKVVWGVQCAEGAAADAGTSLVEAAKDAGASFVVLTPKSPASELFTQVEQMDLVEALEIPSDDMALLMFRVNTSVPVQVGLFSLDFRAADVARLTLTDVSRLSVVFQSMRFPSLVTVREAPDATGIRVLVRAGVDGFVLQGAGVDAQRLGEQVKTLRDDLEKTPVRPEDRSSPSLGGLAGTTTPAATPEREPKPDRE